MKLSVFLTYYRRISQALTITYMVLSSTTQTSASRIPSLRRHYPLVAEAKSGLVPFSFREIPEALIMEKKRHHNIAHVMTNTGSEELTPAHVAYDLLVWNTRYSQTSKQTFVRQIIAAKDNRTINILNRMCRAVP